jgi:hypothetical protein
MIAILSQNRYCVFLKDFNVLSKDLLKEEARFCGRKTMEEEVVLSESLEGGTTKRFLLSSILGAGSLANKNFFQSDSWNSF